MALPADAEDMVALVQVAWASGAYCLSIALIIWMMPFSEMSASLTAWRRRLCVTYLIP